MNRPPPGPRSHTLPGVNLAPGEALRLLLLLCGPPWLFAALLVLTRLTPLPSDLLGWLVTLLAGPAAWGAFISAVADGRTLLGRPRVPAGSRRRLWAELRTPPTQITATVEVGTVQPGGQVTGVGVGQISGPVTIHSTVVTPSGEPRPDPAALCQAYLNRVQTICNALPLMVIDPRAVERTRQQTMDLLPLYVALHTRTLVPVEEEAAKAAGKGDRRTGMPGGEREMRSLSALEAAARDRLLVLLGDPGSGKSTFANYLALCLAGARLEQMGETGVLPGDNWLTRLGPAWPHGSLLPLQVILRQFAKSQWCDGTAAGLESFVAETLAGQGLRDFAPPLRQQLMDGGVLVLLDGLDEVADPSRRQAVRDAVADFVVTHNHPANRYLVTCRGYAYQDPCCQLDRFAVHTLAPFNQEQIDAFIGCWYDEVCRLGWKNERDAKELTERLQRATRRPDLAPLAGSPLQLAMMASLHFSWGRLPDDRVELYQEMVRLLLVRWQEARLGQEAGVTQTVSINDLEAALARVAFVAHHAQGGAEGMADISQATLLGVLKDYLDGSWDRAGAMVAYIQDRAGLLIDRGRGVYTFPHRSYQEYLAGAYLAVQPDFPDETADLVRGNYAQWREAALWAVGVVARLNMTHVAVDAAAALCPGEVPAGEISETAWRTAYLAGEALLEAGLKKVQARERYTPVLTRVRSWLVALLERGALAPTERAAAGRVLARLEDPRVAVIAPEKMEFCLVPAGPFVMGSQDDPDAYDDEHPRHTCNIPYDYGIGRYPVTNAQFRAFVEDGGYRERRYWAEAAAAGRWKDGKIRRREYYLDERGNLEIREVGEGDAPADYGEPFNLPNHPVVGITWYEALAFTRWLSERLCGIIPAGYVVRLPTEAEWEKAARGGTQIPQVPGTCEGPGTLIANPLPEIPQVPGTCEVPGTLIANPLPARRYPWGNEPDPIRANYYDTGIGATSAVGCFPGGVSPYGVLDMSGNVWEWMQSLWGKDLQKPDFKYPYAPDDGREDLAAGADILRVVRGGSFINNARGVRCAVRHWDDPLICYGNLGFRVVCVSHHS